MENYIKVVDFYGLPGCGKSTVSHIVACRLRETGLRVSEPSHNFAHNKSSTIRKAAKILSTIEFVLFNPIKSKQISDIIKKNGHVKKMPFLSQFVNIVFKQNLIRHSGSKYDVIIFDEGIAQDSIGLSVNAENTVFNDVIPSSDNFRALINVFKDDYRYIFIELSENVETALYRIDHRNVEGSRIEKTNDVEKKKQLMCSFQVGCSSINELMKRLEHLHYVVNVDVQSPNKKAELVIDYINENL
jgi:hypothetical protein